MGQIRLESPSKGPPKVPPFRACHVSQRGLLLVGRARRTDPREVATFAPAKPIGVAHVRAT